MYLLGYDVGSSSIKASLILAETGTLAGAAVSPEREMKIYAPSAGHAEQDPEVWWKHVVKATRKILSETGVSAKDIRAIGIAYQMHGLVLIDEKGKPLRPSIIWCDGRAVETGKKAFRELGESWCLEHYLNSPGNFTASKLNWVKENEPDIFKKAAHFMLPGDYIAMKMTGKASTTYSGLSEAILWDYRSGDIARELMDHYGIPNSLVPEMSSNMSPQGQLTPGAAEELGLAKGTLLTYRTGDQPNNALSLNVMNPGEVAATAGTSGVIYGVTDKPLYDEKSRVNTFVHVNHKTHSPRYGVLLCINGTGILYSWLKNNLLKTSSHTYRELNEMAETIPAGAEGMVVLPFGNGPERSLENLDLGARIEGIQFNHHNSNHLIRAAQEGIAFAMNYGLQIMEGMGVKIEKIRAAHTNMFQSRVFTETFANITGKSVELYETDGSVGAAIGAGIGAGAFNERKAFAGLTLVKTVETDVELSESCGKAYQKWLSILNQTVENSS